MSPVSAPELFALLALVVSYGVGSLPLGGRLVRLISGQNPRATSAHNLGVENLVRFVGLPAALGSFALDVTKGVFVLGRWNLPSLLRAPFGKLADLSLAALLGRSREPAGARAGLSAKR